ISLVACHL
ncbi:hypothetical protein BVZ47_01732B, partial [Haemophilus influenzae]